MLKILGALLLIASGTAGGILAIKNILKKIDFLEEFLKFIHDLKTKIRYQNLILSEVLNGISCAEPFYTYLNKCKNSLNSTSFPDAWESTFSGISNKTGITLEEENLIKNFGKNLGQSDLKGQLSHCDYYIQAIQPHLEKAREEQKTKIKIYLSLGISIGTALALILF